MLIRLLVAVVQATAAPPARKPFTVDVMWQAQRVGTPVLSPDGRLVAYTVTRYDMEENRGNGDVWVVAVAGGEPQRLTFNKASDGSPAWSPDGRRLAFVSKRDGDGAAQLYVLSLEGGEPERLTDMPMAVTDPRWFPDGKRIAFVSHVIAGAETPDATRKALDEREKSKLKVHVTENRLYRFWDRWLTLGEYPHIFVLDLETRQVTDLLPGSTRYFGLQDGSGSFDISPDGRSIVFAANGTPEPYRTLNSDLFLVPAAGGEMRNLTADNPADDDDPVFSPDGSRIAYGRQRRAEGWPDYTRLAVLDLASGATRVLTEAVGRAAAGMVGPAGGGTAPAAGVPAAPGLDASVGGWAWTRDGRTLVFHAEVRARTSVYAVPAGGGALRELHHGGTTAGVEVSVGGDVIFQRSDLDHPPELWAVRLDGKGLRPLTHVNDALMSQVALGPVVEKMFPGAGGAQVQMFVVYPPGFERGRRYPLVQLVHGGPVGTFGDNFHFRWNAHAFAAPGYVVALVNFHGSSSFGQTFVESILGAHPEKPFEDVMKATDVLIAEGSVDPQRLAAAGGSYGGFLVNWIAGHTDRFQALVSHAGVYGLLGQSASDSTFGRQHSYGGYPFTELANIEKWSPNRYAANFKTPMLILHGERDYRVPVTQGLELYGVLTAKGVPARLVHYPEENHWILKPQASRHWYGEVLGWLARWLR